MICSCCGIDKPSDDFYKTYRQCKQCTVQKVMARSERNREQYLAYHRDYYKKHCGELKKSMQAYRERLNSLKTDCAKCGETRRWVIDFHHINPKEKSFNIPRKTAITDFETVKKEAEKCICLCRNCHAEFHYFYGTNPKEPIKSLQEYLKGQANETIKS